MIKYEEIPGFEEWVNSHEESAYDGNQKSPFDLLWYLPETCQLALVQEYLREAHGVDVWAQPFIYKELSGKDKSDGTYSFFIYKKGVWAIDRVNFIGSSEALKEGIKEAIKLIKK